MKIKYKGNEGELMPVSNGICLVTDEGAIYFPEYLCTIQDPEGLIYVYPAVYIPDDHYLSISEEDNIQTSLMYYDIQRFVENEIRENRLEDTERDKDYLIKKINLLIEEVHFRKIFISEVALTRIKNKEYLNLLKQTNNGKNGY